MIQNICGKCFAFSLLLVFSQFFLYVLNSANLIKCSHQILENSPKKIIIIIIIIMIMIMIMIIIIIII